MEEIRLFARKGGAILGICNGFQILTEARLLPGALLPNESGRFVCKQSPLSLAPGTSGLHESLASFQLKTWDLPIAHGDGRYYHENPNELVDQGRVLFYYQENPNGSLCNIAGVLSENGRILGMMPHPERAMNEYLGGSQDGRLLLKAFFEGVSL